MTEVCECYPTYSYAVSCNQYGECLKCHKEITWMKKDIQDFGMLVERDD